MTLREFYQLTGGDYDETLARMTREDLIRRFLGIFCRGKEFDKLTTALESGADEAAFDAVHTLKGNALNIGLGNLGRSASDLTEALRNGRKPEADPLFQKVKEDYETVLQGLDALD